jgi:hypothetical protein
MPIQGFSLRHRKKAELRRVPHILDDRGSKEEGSRRGQRPSRPWPVPTGHEIARQKQGRQDHGRQPGEKESDRPPVVERLVKHVERGEDGEPEKEE